MRRWWIAVALIIVVVGFAAGYRVGHRDHPAEASAQPSHSAEAPDDAVPPGERPASGPSSGEAAAEGRTDASPPSAKPVVPTAATERRSTGTTAWASGTLPAAPPPSGTTISGEAAVASNAPHQRNDTARPATTPPASPTSNPAVAQANIPAAAPAAAPAGEAAKPDAKPEEKPATPVDPESDRQPPTLEYLRFDPPEVQDGGTVVLSIGTSDNLAGVKSVVGMMRSPSQAGVSTFAAQDAGGGVFTTSITIPHQAETGDWFVGMLQIVDKADNPLYLTFVRTTVPAEGVLHVVSADSDSTPPTVHRVVLEKETLSGGEKNLVTVDVDDDRSGVAFVSGWFQSQSKAARIPFNCAARAEGVWAGDLLLPADADCGEWSLSMLRVTDKAKNYAVVPGDSPQLGRVSFLVNGGGGCDSEAPDLDALVASPTVVSNSSAAEVVLTITTHDQGSGLLSLDGRFEGPPAANGQIPKLFFVAQADPKNPDATIAVKVQVPQYAAQGIWRVAFLELIDKARNTRTFQGADPALANAYFNVE